MAPVDDPTFLHDFPVYKGFSVKVLTEGNTDAERNWSYSSLIPEEVLRSAWDYIWRTPTKGAASRVAAKRLRRSNPSELWYQVGDGQLYVLQLSNQNRVRCNAVVSIDGETIGSFRLSPGQTITVERPADVDRRFKFVAETGAEASRAGVRAGARENGLVKVVFLPELVDDDDDELSDRVFARSSAAREMAMSHSGGRTASRVTERYGNLSNSLSANRGSEGMRSDRRQPDAERSMYMSSRGSASSDFGMARGMMMPQSFDRRADGTTHSSGATVLAGKSDQRFSNAENMSVDSSRSVTVHLRLVVPNTSVDLRDTPIAVSGYHQRKFETPIPGRIEDGERRWGSRGGRSGRDPLTDSVSF